MAGFLIFVRWKINDIRGLLLSSFYIKEYRVDMIISIGKKKTWSDIEFVQEIQKRTDRVTETFYNVCRKYFMNS